MVLIDERIEMADTFDHYAAVTDAPDRDRRVFRNKMERVIMEMLDFYKIEEGFEDLARQVARMACHKPVKDMLYEARTQAIVDFHAARDVRIKRENAVTMTLTKEEYLEAIPWWMATHPDCWQVQAHVQAQVQAQVQSQLQAQTQEMFSYFQAQFAAIGHPLPTPPMWAPRPPISSPPMPRVSGVECWGWGWGGRRGSIGSSQSFSTSTSTL
ncbi:hypothetical protein EJB05_28518 [Eragrostis curvula]|uniref:Uncharacterized protein n=1 Tax=Eragrostis curvula TaxID=38414 RepID=A0A5J9URJ3_9POAL|nr:hypothetical protein EJB05_28518 [Eragrostis curvula]